MRKLEALNPKHPELTALAQSAGKYALYVSWFAAQRALTTTPVDEPPVPSILECLRTFDIRGAISQRTALTHLVDALDQAYWTADDAEPRNEGRVQEAFRRARAANALLSALEGFGVQAALDAVYEAYHSMPEEEGEAFVESVKEKLRYYATLP